jgi:hypothetical protein
MSTIDIDEAKLKRNEFSLWLSWTLATALGMLVGALPLALLVKEVDLGLVRVFVPIITGALLGFAQWLVLRPYVARSADWVLNHAAGWVIGFSLGLILVQAFAKTTLGTLIGFIFFGIIIALFQFPVLRREIPHLGTWILANVIGWTAGAYLSLAVQGLLFRGTAPNTFSSTLVSVGTTGLVAGAITGLALILIVRQPDRLSS